MEELENTDILAVLATLLCRILTCGNLAVLPWHTKFTQRRPTENLVQNVEACPDYEHIAEHTDELEMHLKMKVTMCSANIKVQFKEMQKHMPQNCLKA